MAGNPAFAFAMADEKRGFAFAGSSKDKLNVKVSMDGIRRSWLLLKIHQWWKYSAEDSSQADTTEKNGPSSLKLRRARLEAEKPEKE